MCTTHSLSLSLAHTDKQIYNVCVLCMANGPLITVLLRCDEKAFIKLIYSFEALSQSTDDALWIGKKVSGCMSGSGSEVANSAQDFVNDKLYQLKIESRRRRRARTRCAHQDKTYSFPFSSFVCNINKHVCICVCSSTTMFMFMCSYISWKLWAYNFRFSHGSARENRLFYQFLFLYTLWRRFMLKLK